MKPNKRNFCGGAFPDWLEVNLTDKCNGNCSWCIEKEGYHPTEHATWKVIADAALGHGALNIILLGGEPTLFKYIGPLITHLTSQNRQVWMTTNGSLLSYDYVSKNLAHIHGVNVSIHDWNLKRNFEITGIPLSETILSEAIKTLHVCEAQVRLNCNCIRGHIDTPNDILKYVRFAKRIGADKVRFAELKQDDEGFVDLAKILNYKYGLNDNPFRDGCISDVVINGMPVNFRQMCGLQTSRRERPRNPEQIMKKVLYYDGKIYDGWQIGKQGDKMETREILEMVKMGELTVGGALKLLDAKSKEDEKEEPTLSSGGGGGGGCQY